MEMRAAAVPPMNLPPPPSSPCLLERVRHDSGLWHLIISIHAVALLICIFGAPFVRRALIPDHAGPLSVWGPLEYRLPDQHGGPRDSVQAGYWIFYTFGIALTLLLIISAIMTCRNDEFIEPDVDLDLRTAAEDLVAEDHDRATEIGHSSDGEGSHLRFRSFTSGTIDGVGGVSGPARAR